MKTYAGYARLGTIIVIAALVIGLFIVLQNQPQAAAFSGSTTSLDLVLMRCGLSPQALTAAGVDSENVATVVADADEELAEQSATLADADGDVVTHTATVQHLEPLVRSGTATGAQATEYQAAKQSLATAQAQQQAALDTIFTAAVSALTADQQQALQNIRTASGWNVPIHYQVVQRTQGEWLALRNALNSIRVSNELDATPDPEAQDLCDDADADADVAAAELACDTSLQTITNAWNNAVNSQ